MMLVRPGALPPLIRAVRPEAFQRSANCSCSKGRPSISYRETEERSR